MKYNFYDTFKDNVGDPLESDDMREKYKKFLIFLQRELNLPVSLIDSKGELVAYLVEDRAWWMYYEDIYRGRAWFESKEVSSINLELFLMKFLADSYIGTL